MMIDDTRALVRAFKRSGATNKKFTTMVKGWESFDTPHPTTDLDALVSAAVRADLGSQKLAASLAEIADSVASAEAFEKVLRVANAYADEALVEYVTSNTNELIGQIGDAIQPVLDRFVSQARLLPKYVETSRFPVRPNWTPEQFTIWSKIGDDLNQIKATFSDLRVFYAGIGEGQLSVPGVLLPWFGWIEPQGYTGQFDETTGQQPRVGTFTETSRDIEPWIAVAHMPKTELRLVGPKEARERLLEWSAARTASMKGHAQSKATTLASGQGRRVTLL